MVREGYSRSRKEEQELASVGRRRKEEGEERYFSQREQHGQNPGAGREVWAFEEQKEGLCDQKVENEG